MARNDELHTKIKPEHLERAAYVYVRQSTFHQVEHHRESTRRQYDLVGWASEAGWPREKIVVVDEDQGVSAAAARSRSGFERLASAVGRSEVGIALESRGLASRSQQSRLASSDVSVPLDADSDGGRTCDLRSLAWR